MSDVRRHFKRSPAEEWTLERIAQLSVQDIKQLRENAERLHEAGVAALCSEALRVAPPRRRAQAARTSTSGPRIRARRLIARANAFETRGVWLQDRRTSWSGVRKSDGAVVMALWADAIHSADGGCSCLLWAPNLDGSRPWSDQPAGRERLEHCKRARELGQAEGLLVYGERLDGYLPEEKAFAVHGVDPETVVRFRVEMRGAEFWATWGRKASASMQQRSGRAMRVRAMMTSLSQVAVMGAIVTCLLYLPAGMVLALVFALFGFSLEDMVTFDGTFSIYSGLFAWWLLTFGGACIYAVYAFPWEEKVLAWPRKK